MRRLLDDPRLGRSHPEPDRAARTGESALFGGPLGDYDTEDADHARMRSLLQPHFTPRRIRALRPRVEALATALLDELARHGPPADLVEALAVPLPVLVICELLGVPYADRDRFRAWTRDVSDVRDRARSERGLAGLFGYGQQLVARKRAQPGDDVISGLCASCSTTARPIMTGPPSLIPNGSRSPSPAVSHLSFGHGARYCIGAPLARIELQAVFSGLVPHFPAMRLAEPAGQLTVNRDTLAGGLTRLPVTW